MCRCERRLKTWGGSKSVRLAGFDYAQHAPYHVVVRTHPGTAPFANSLLATAVCTLLRETSEELGTYLGVYCLMPDHLHTLVSPDRSGLELGNLVGRFKGLTTNASWDLGWTGKLWQPRFYDHIVRKSEGIAEVARYIYENPERKGFDSGYPYRWIDPSLA